MVNLFPHQQKAVRELGNGKVLWGDVGTGKTLTAMAYYMEKEAPRDVYVITTAKKRDSLDWEADAAKYGISTHEGLSAAGLLHVDSWNNIEKYIGVKDAFFIFDEQRLVGSGKWVKSFYKIARDNRWILLTATPGDTWLDYAPIFIANGWYKNITEFRREHVVYSYRTKFPKVERYIGESRLRRLRNYVLVEMPYLRHTTRHVHDVEVSYDRELFDKVVKKRWHVYEHRPLRDVAELFSVMRKVVNSDPSRLQVVRELHKTHSKLIVFYNFDYELEELRKLGQDSSSSTNPKSSSLITQKLGSEPIRQSLSTESTSLKGSNESSKFSRTQTTGGPRQKSELPESSHSSETSLTSSEGRTESCIPENGEKRSTTSEARFIGTSREPTSHSPISSGHTTTTLSSTSSGELVVFSDETATMSSLESGTDQTLSPKTATSGKKRTTGTGRQEFSFAVAEWNGHKHEPIPETDSWIYLVQYSAGSEAWNCTDTDAICFYSLNYSYRITHQCMGRIDRLNTPFQDLHYYFLTSKSLIDKAIQKALRGKKNFNESAFGLDTSAYSPRNRSKTDM